MRIRTPPAPANARQHAAEVANNPETIKMQPEMMTVDNSMGEEAFEAFLQRVEDRHGFVRVAAGDALEAFASSGDSLVLLTENPRQCPEAWDLAVVLPEVLKQFAGRVRPGVATPAESAEIARRFAVTRFPALLFQRDGHYVGVMEGMRDWASFAPAIEHMLASPVGRAPGIGIPVRAATSGACH